MIIFRQKRFLYILISLSIILLDQISKYYLSINYQEIYNKDLFIFTIDYVKNYGAAFNIFSGNRILLSIISILFSFILFYLILSRRIIKSIELYSYSFILGGAVGNGIDRILKGYVLDFININFLDFPIFNIADISINIGFALFLYSMIKTKKI